MTKLKIGLVAALLAVLLVAGAVFASSAIQKDAAADNNDAPAETGIKEKSCGCGSPSCNQQCGGSCGISSCGCGKVSV